MKRAILGMVVVILAACQTTQVKYYEVPEGSQGGEAATIVGTRVDPDKWFLADEITYVLGIDGDPIEGGKNVFKGSEYLKSKRWR